MDRIRAFTQDDIPHVAGLYQQVFGGGPACPSEGLHHYFHEVFFENPWRDRDLSSLVYERDGGVIAGFLGVIPRRFNLKGRSLKAAISTQFMVDDGHRKKLAGLQLMKTFFSGPQDLSFTDGANESSRRIWKALGGVEVPVYSICWTRRLAGEGGVTPENDRTETASRFLEEDLDVPTAVEHLPRFARTVSLWPEYDQVGLSWLLSLAEGQRRHGPLQKRVLRHAGRVEGWYLYYLNVGGTSQVLQLVASPSSYGAVLNHLFGSLRRLGATAVSGRLDPQHLHELSRRQCQFSAGSAVLARASDPALREAIYQGDALLSRLEGEWWNAFRECLAASPPAAPHPAGGL